MEYEIEGQGERALFDPSTNPSLEGEEDEERSLFFRNSTRRLRQKGELIPEEEEQLA